MKLESPAAGLRHYADPVKVEVMKSDFIAGTYLKVVRFPEPGNSDAYLALYLRPKGLFLFAGYWRGYERSAAAGVWHEGDGKVTLTGVGVIEADSMPQPNAPPFERTLVLQDEVSTPTLRADASLDDWSLLGWRGLYTYVGANYVVNPDDQWLPRNLAEVDEWIARSKPPVGRGAASPYWRRQSH